MMSLGSRSGVHWILENLPLTASEIAFAAVVLARPGTDSIKICPSATTAVISDFLSSSCPTTLVEK